MKKLILFIALVTSPAVAQEGPFPQTCTYEDTIEPEEDAAHEVSCTMRYESTPGGIRYSFRFGGRTVVVETAGEGGVGLWRPARINGNPGVRLELRRGSYIAVTSDARLSFEWRDRNEPKYPVN